MLLEHVQSSFIKKKEEKIPVSCLHSSNNYII